MNAATWAGRRVLVTGHTGFKGSWLSLWLESLGARVTGLALAPETEPALFEVLGLGTRLHDHRADVRDPAAVARVFDACRPEVVFHLAAQALVRDSYREPVATFATNVMGTAHVLEAARRCDSLRAVVVATSDKCYENDETGRAFREGDPLGGRDPYSASKAGAELVAASWRASFPGTSCAALATVRAGNVIGGGDWARDRIVPDLVRGFAAGQPVPIRNPRAVRPWQHVLEPLAGYLRVAEVLLEGGADCATAWNFGPDAAGALPVAELVAQAAARWGDGAQWTHDAEPQPHEARLLQLDSARARTRLGWVPRWTTGRAIDETIDWYRAHQRGADMRAYSLAQIHRYLETLDVAA
jgi:CDP-glucose 4,6-dehydratase